MGDPAVGIGPAVGIAANVSVRARRRGSADVAWNRLFGINCLSTLGLESLTTPLVAGQLGTTVLYKTDEVSSV